MHKDAGLRTVREKGLGRVTRWKGTSWKHDEQRGGTDAWNEGWNSLSESTTAPAITDTVHIHANHTKQQRKGSQHTARAGAGDCVFAAASVWSSHPNRCGMKKRQLFLSPALARSVSRRHGVSDGKTRRAPMFSAFLSESHAHHVTVHYTRSTRAESLARASVPTVENVEPNASVCIQMSPETRNFNLYTHTLCK